MFCLRNQAFYAHTLPAYTKMMSEVIDLGQDWVKFHVAVISPIPGHTYEEQMLDEGEYEIAAQGKGTGHDTMRSRPPWWRICYLH